MLGAVSQRLRAFGVGWVPRGKCAVATASIKQRMKQHSVILLVENDKDYIYVLEQAFRKAEIRNPLKIARYGNEAILYLRGVGIYADRRNYPLPRLVLLDMTNPDGSSMAVLGWIREQQQFSKMPILILAGSDQENEVQCALDRGANAFLVKRERLAELTSMIHSLELLTEPDSREPQALADARLAANP
jgi:CheY-like chemotaxis protein